MRKNSIKFIFFFALLVNGLVGTETNLLDKVELHGDVRTKWKSEWDGSDQHSFKAEANIGCDYYSPQTWVSVKMKAATSNGTYSLVLLDKAFLGYQAYASDKNGLGIELGRNKMDSIFDSKMQFDSYFNGAHITYTYMEPKLFNLTIHGGPHIVNADKKHYGWIAEGIFKYISETPVTVKYSFTDWNAPKIKNANGWKYDKNYTFTISQITASYEIEENTIYGAYLKNHQEKYYNDGFYFGLTFGKIRDQGDFSFDANFQSSKKWLISPIDFKGLKKGVQIKGTYALANALNLEGKFTFYDDHNGTNNNKRLELQAIYTW